MDERGTKQLIQVALSVVLSLLLLWAFWSLFMQPQAAQEPERAAPSPAPAAAVTPTPTAEASRLALRVWPDAGAGHAGQADTEPEPCGCPPDWFTIPRQDNEQPGPELRLLGEYQVYGYDVCPACCGKSDGITASGTVATVGRTCASNDYPIGTVLYIEGIGERVVEDRGGMAHGVIDVLCEDHPACYAITGRYEVYIVGEAGT